MTKRPLTLVNKQTGETVVIKPTYKRWEYKVARWDPLRNGDLDEWLNRHGSDGWEMLPLAGSSVVFKRELT